MVFGWFSPEDSLNYDKTKLALLQRLRFMAEGYQEKFRRIKPQAGETGKQFSARVLSLFEKWVKLANGRT